ncbi:MAG: sensor domain-containing diguanylate cyclase [Treponema sp.]|jgi:diguanylate cyclase (GGDEF)-like protein|nr:sensor domain-containing diguanylate cyclase [Treponema sp.]
MAGIYTVDIEKTIDEQEKDLFVKIFRKLAAYRDPYQSITDILGDLCDFFGFYSGFVYEADHSHVFHLIERYIHDGASSLKDEFLLSDYLSRRDIELLTGQTGEIVYINSRKNKMGSKFLEFFSAKTLIMVPVIFETQFPIAFAGLMDRRRPIRLSKREIDDADAVLSVLAGHIKTRVYQKRLEYALESMKNIVDNAGLDIYVSDFQSSEVIFANESLVSRYGGSKKVIGKHCWELFSTGKSPGESYDNCPGKNRDISGEKGGLFVWDYHDEKNDTWYHILDTPCHWVDGRLAHVVSSVDITENKKNEELIRKMAEHDTLTGLPNRRKFIQDLENNLKSARTGGWGGYLLFMDLDDFKKTNDTLGHLTGDALLRSIGNWLYAQKDTLGMPYRYGGDEFVIITADRTPKELDSIRDLLLDRFGKRWRLKEHSVKCGISIGACPYPSGEMETNEIIEQADAAMYTVKESGKHGFHLSGPPNNR